MSKVYEEEVTNKLCVEFDSIEDALQTIKDKGWKPENSKDSDTKKEKDFHKFSSLKQALDVYTSKPESITKFNESDIDIKGLSNPVIDVYYDTQGDYVDVGRYLDGEPECFGNASGGQPYGAFANITVCDAHVWWVPEIYINNLQKRILRLTDWLESNGVRTRVQAKTQSKCLNYSLVIKDYQDALDLTEVAIAFHSDWARRVQFLMIEQSKTWSWGYGSCKEYDVQQLNTLEQTDEGENVFDIYIGGYIPLGLSKDRKEYAVPTIENHFDILEESLQECIEQGLTHRRKRFIIGGYEPHV